LQLRHCTSSASWGRGRSHAEGAWPSSKGGNSIPNTDGWDERECRLASMCCSAIYMGLCRRERGE
jgi:hypothetical protein